MSITQNHIKSLFIAGIFLLPFIFWPWTQIPYELPRVWIMLRWIEILGILGCFYILKKAPKRKLPRSIAMALLIFFFTAGITAVIGTDWNKSIHGNPFRCDGLLTYVHLLGLSIFVAWFWQKAWIAAFVRALTFSSTLVSLWALTEWLRLTIFKDASLNLWQGAIGATFGQPNFLAGYLVVTLPFTWYFIKKSANKYLFGLLFIQLLAIIFTRSWGGIISAIIFFLLLLILSRRKKGPAASLTHLQQFLAIVACSVFVLPVYIFTHPTNNFVAESRERIAVKLLYAISERPLSGWGWANVDHAFNNTSWPIYLEHDVYLDKAHSLILESFVTMGIIGGAAYLFLLFSVGRKLYQNINNSTRNIFWHQTVFLVFILFLLHSQMNVIPTAEEMIFWILTGIAMMA